ncbi:MAG TPA: hypothetical protein VJ599_08405 [Nitrososphaeraceae archaeon]|nr:hypothetical protein [Nitrososphaeraceae archaeon]
MERYDDRREKINDEIAPRKSTSEHSLKFALDYAKNKLDADSLMIDTRNFQF